MYFLSLVLCMKCWRDSKPRGLIPGRRSMDRSPLWVTHIMSDRWLGSSGQCTWCQHTSIMIWVCYLWYFLCVLTLVWRRRALCRQERFTDREDVRLPSGSFLQLLPTEVLISQSHSHYTARVYFIMYIFKNNYIWVMSSSTNECNKSLIWRQTLSLSSFLRI